MFSPLLILLTIIGAIVMRGNPFFVQLRPGKNERIFLLIKFRTMTCEKDKNGNLLPDEKRLTKYGKFLRFTSLDELPELLNIIKGDMSYVGPRPQLIRDMVFMTERQRKRHTVLPGLTGLAQVNGRNNINWEEKLNYDIQYIENITLFNDIIILFKTIYKVLLRKDICTEGMTTSEDYGEYLLRSDKISSEKYYNKIKEVEVLLSEKKGKRNE